MIHDRLEIFDRGHGIGVQRLVWLVFNVVMGMLCIKARGAWRNAHKYISAFLITTPLLPSLRHNWYVLSITDPSGARMRFFLHHEYRMLTLNGIAIADSKKKRKNGLHTFSSRLPLSDTRTKIDSKNCDLETTTHPQSHVRILIHRETTNSLSLNRKIQHRLQHDL